MSQSKPKVDPIVYLVEHSTCPSCNLLLKEPDTYKPCGHVCCHNCSDVQCKHEWKGGENCFQCPSPGCEAWIPLGERVRHELLESILDLKITQIGEGVPEEFTVLRESYEGEI